MTVLLPRIAGGEAGLSQSSVAKYFPCSAYSAHRGIVDASWFHVLHGVNTSLFLSDMEKEEQMS